MNRGNAKNLVTLPNVITLARLLSVPVAVWCVDAGHHRSAFWLFIAAGVSDGVDGYIARRYRLQSDLGARLDPLADKALLMAMYGMLAVTGAMPVWLASLVIGRDCLILGGFILVVSRHGGRLRGPLPVAPLRISKMNTALQIILAGLVLGGQGYGLAVGFTGLAWLIEPLVIVVAVSTVLSGAAIIDQWSRDRARRRREKIDIGRREGGHPHDQPGERGQV